MGFAVWLLVALTAQEGLDRLIEELGSNDTALRDKALQQLKQCDRSTRPAFEKAAQSADPEVSKSARFLLRRLEIVDLTTPALRKLEAGIVDRLASPQAHEWTLIFLKGDDRELEASDLEPLAVPALQAAATDDERLGVLFGIQRNRIRRAFPEVMKFLNDSYACTRHNAARTAMHLNAAEAKAQVIALLKDPSWCVPFNVLPLIEEYRLTEAIQDVRPLLAERNDLVRGRAARALGELGDRTSGPGILKLLSDADGGVRLSGVLALMALGMKESTPEILTLLSDPDDGVRAASLRALQHLATPREKEFLIPLLKDPNVEVHEAAGEALCWLGSSEGVALILDRKGKPALFGLNRLRQERVWTKLADKQIQERTVATLEEGLRVVVEDTGLILKDLPEDWKHPGRPIRCSGSALTVLEDLISKEWFCVVMEDSGLRFLRANDGLAFWKTWWQQEQKK